MKQCARDNWQQWACHFESDWEFSGFFLPVSTSRLEKLLGSGAMQIPSGKSIVVVPETNNNACFIKSAQFDN